MAEEREGGAGQADGQSRRPSNSPSRNEWDWEAKIVAAWTTLTEWGVLYIRRLLLRQGMERLPADTMIHGTRDIIAK